MNNECGAKNSYYAYTYCKEPKGHLRAHSGLTAARELVSWPQTFSRGGYEPAHPAGRASGKTANWSGVIDEDLKLVQAAFKATATPETHPVPLTVEDLKVIAFFMSNHGMKQAPETAAKIDKALKAAL